MTEAPMTAPAERKAFDDWWAAHGEATLFDAWRASALRARVPSEVAEALTAFAKFANVYAPQEDDHFKVWIDANDVPITVGDLRRAKRALALLSSPQPEGERREIFGPYRMRLEPCGGGHTNVTIPELPGFCVMVRPGEDAREIAKHPLPAFLSAELAASQRHPEGERATSDYAAGWAACMTAIRCLLKPIPGTSLDVAMAALQPHHPNGDV